MNKGSITTSQTGHPIVNGWDPIPFYHRLREIRTLTANSILNVLDSDIPDEDKLQELRAMSQMLLED